MTDFNVVLYKYRLIFLQKQNYVPCRTKNVEPFEKPSGIGQRRVIAATVEGSCDAAILINNITPRHVTVCPTPDNCCFSEGHYCFVGVPLPECDILNNTRLRYLCQ